MNFEWFLFIIYFISVTYLIALYFAYVSHSIVLATTTTLLTWRNWLLHSALLYFVYYILYFRKHRMIVLECIFSNSSSKFQTMSFPATPTTTSTSSKIKYSAYTCLAYIIPSVISDTSLPLCHFQIVNYWPRQRIHEFILQLTSTMHRLPWLLIKV